jgi:hypothetical protein
VTRAALTFVVLTRKPPSLSRPFSTPFALRSQSAAALSRARAYSDRVRFLLRPVWSGGGLAEECSNPSVTWKAGDTSFLFFSFSFLFFSKSRRVVLSTTKQAQA